MKIQEQQIIKDKRFLFFIKKQRKGRNKITRTGSVELKLNFSDFCNR